MRVDLRPLLMKDKVIKLRNFNVSFFPKQNYCTLFVLNTVKASNGGLNHYIAIELLVVEQPVSLG